MKSVKRISCVFATAVALGFAAPSNGHAQAAAPLPSQNVVSANPFGILLEWFNLEYERVVTESATIGAGGSVFTDDDVRYRNFDFFGRFYLRDYALEGPMFGAKVGLTSVADQGTYPGVGFDFNWSWLMGRNDNFYVGVGFGLKRLLGVDEEDAELIRYVPTFRLVNVGVAF